jgi:hypothetical protein
MCRAVFKTTSVFISFLRGDMQWYSSTFHEMPTIAGVCRKGKENYPKNVYRSLKETIANLGIPYGMYAPWNTLTQA